MYVCFSRIGTRIQETGHIERGHWICTGWILPARVKCGVRMRVCIHGKAPLRIKPSSIVTRFLVAVMQWIESGHLVIKYLVALDEAKTL